LNPHASPQHFFGAELRRLRTEAGLNLRELGEKVHYSGGTIGAVEKAQRWPNPELARAVDHVLSTRDVLTRLLPLVEAQRASEQVTSRHSAPTSAAPDLPLTSDRLNLSSGRALTGATIALKPFEPDVRPLGFQRTLAISSFNGRTYAMDALEVRLQHRVAIPSAYELDDFTYALLWATANLDDALLADDASLTQSLTMLAQHEQLQQFTAPLEAVSQLNPASQMWLGSYFCARHILRHTPRLTDVPVFWTAEKHGEDTANWLLFQHKHDYLGRIRHLFGTTTRTFCIPESVVQQAPRHDRILLFLSIALMEPFGIAVVLTTDPAYAKVGGFVLNPNDRAIVANWVTPEGTWHVDNTRRQSVVGEFEDIAGHANASSLIRGHSSRLRLQATAAYLGLDWGWLLRRASELAVVGVRPLARPRSRLLSAAGFDDACAYLAGFRATDSAN
jgi:transcriptional regulator with XRE-family HTH domain